MNYYEDNGWEREFLHHMPDLPFFGEWADNFNVDDYMDWFAPININTLIWQGLIIFLIFWFFKDIIRLVNAIIDKIPQINYFGLTGIGLSDETKKDVKEKSPQLDKKLKTYENTVPKTTKATKTTKDRDTTMKDPGIAFLRVFIDVEILLRELHLLVFNTKDSRYVRAKTLQTMFSELFRVDVLNKRFLNDFKSAVILRNKIVHGQELPYSLRTIDVYSKALLLLKDELDKSIKQYKIKKD